MRGMKHLLLLALLLVPGPALADDRHVGIGSFSRLRVDGPIEVRVTTGASPGATVSGDRAVTETIELQSNGDALVVRRNGSNQWSEQGAAVATRPVVVTLTTPALTSASVTGAGRLQVTRLTGARMTLTVSGPGAIQVDGVEGEALAAQLVGAGTVTVGGGKVTTARLTASGTIDTGAVDAGELLAVLDGLGAITARARYAAQVSNSGLGTVTVAGHPKCSVRAAAGGPVRCGD
jgi:hypothetical protein